MNEYPWATPRAIGSLTITQVMALGHGKPPGQPKPIDNYEDLMKQMAAIEASEAAEAAAWRGVGG